MLNITDELKTVFLTDSTPKELTVEHGTPDKDRNYYSCWPTFIHTYSSISPGNGRTVYMLDKDGQDTSELQECADMTIMHNFGYMCVSFLAYISNFSGTVNNVEFSFALYNGQGGGGSFKQKVAISDITTAQTQITMYLPTAQYVADGGIGFQIPIDETGVFSYGDVSFSNMMVTYDDDSSVFPKPYVPYSEASDYFKLSNDQILSESFSLNESLCSEENIKFGLCEAAYCQFTVTDDYHDFRELEIKPYIGLNKSTKYFTHIVMKRPNLYDPYGSSEYLPHPGNTLTLTWSNAALSNPHYPATQLRFTLSVSAGLYYRDLYKFVKITYEFKITNVSFADVTPAKILFFPNVRLYKSNVSETQRFYQRWNDAQFSAEHNYVCSFSEAQTDFVKVSYVVPVNFVKYFAQFGDEYVEEYVNAGATTLDTPFHPYQQFLDSNGNYFTDSSQRIGYTAEFKNVQINFVDSEDEEVPEYDVADCIEYNGTSLQAYVNSYDADIPLGVFTVTSIKKNYTNDILKQEITAYDKLTLLEQNAADWYTQYMFGMDSDTAKSTSGLEYARQIFSTYFNYVLSLGLDSKNNYTETVVSHNEYLHANYIPITSDISVSWTDSLTARAGNIKYTKYTVSSINPSKLYVVNINLLKDMEYLKPYVARTNYFDSLNRGLITGNILISEDTGNKYCVDPGDYFMVSPNCTELTIFIAIRLVYIGPSDTGVYVVGDSDSANITIDICEVDSAPDLSNGHTRLVYYNYDTKEIFACDSSITGRDVVRSLLEVNGCFYRLNRYTGKPEFVYCNKSGLYPRDDLYPADDLYPRLGSNQTINMSQYQSFIQEDYEVQRFGRIQILKNITSNQTKSVVEWEYVGDADFKNSYLIEDNIFYCNDKMEYDYDGMPEVLSMLENMWLRISNMNYVPCVLKCIGMPWIECGDRVGTLTKTGGAETFVFHRTLKGIQSLIDTFESEGDEYNKEVKDYGYKEWEG